MTFAAYTRLELFSIAGATFRSSTALREAVLGLRVPCWYIDLRFSASAYFSAISSLSLAISAALFYLVSSAIFFARFTSSSQRAAISASSFSRAACAASAFSSLYETLGVAFAAAARSLTCSAWAALSARRAFLDSIMEARRRCCAICVLRGPPWLESAEE